MCFSSPDYQEDPTVFEEKLLEIAEERLQHYQQGYIPAENQYMRDTERMNTRGYQQLMTDKATTAARLSSPAFQAGAGQGGNIKVGATSDVLNQAQQLSLAASTGNQVATEQYYGRNLNMVGVGNGQAGTAMQTTGNIAANEAGLAAAQSSAQSQRRNAMWNMGGAMAGAGLMAGNEKWGWFGTDDAGGIG